MTSDIKLEPCEYCGSLSQELSKSGHCVGCGAPRKEEKVFPTIKGNDTRYMFLSTVCSTSSDIGYLCAST